YPDVQENPLTNDEFEAFIKANDGKINNLETEFDHFQKQCKQMQDDLLNQMRNFIQNFQNGPPGEDKEHKATTDTELFSTKDIQPLPVHEPSQNSDMHQIIEECCVEATCIKANDDKINNLETKFDHFQKQCEQMQDDLLNQMRNFIQNFQNGPPGEDKEHEATTDTELLSTEDIHPLAIQEPPWEFDICQLVSLTVLVKLTSFT
nr:hypothetical protein [Tanacetum cinerariifolium]